MHQGNHRDHEGAEKLYGLIKDVKFAMMTTVDTDGAMHSRPMYSQDADEVGDLWFFTKLHSPKITEISKDNKINLAYSDPSSQNYVSIAGHVEIVRDEATKKAKWSEGMRTWLPKGPEDPDVALLRVHPETGQYWDGASSTMQYLYGYAKAVATGKPPHELSEQKKVNLA